MCGIVGLICPSGLTKKHVKKFINMLVRCQSRGHHATGVFTSNMKMLKAPLPSSTFVTANKFKQFIKSQLEIGMTYIVGHTRHATRGNPKINTNNHPFPGKNNSYFLVHNGSVSCGKYDKDTTITDTYIHVEAINSFVDDHELMDAVQRGFEDVERTAKSNRSVVVVGSPNSVVFCKSRISPLVFQTVESKNMMLFASTSDIMKPEQNVVNEQVKKKRWEELNDDSVVIINTDDLTTIRGFLRTKNFPVPTNVLESYDESFIDTELINELQNVVPRVGTKRKVKKKRKNKTSVQPYMTVSRKEKIQQENLRTIDHLRGVDEFLYDEIMENTDQDNGHTCYDCINSMDMNDEQDLLWSIRERMVECMEFGYEKDPCSAKGCPAFDPR